MTSVFKIGRFIRPERTITKKTFIEEDEGIPELKRVGAKPPRLKPKKTKNLLPLKEHEILNIERDLNEHHRY